MSLTLYTIAQEHRTLADRLQDMDLDEQTVLDTLEGESMLMEKSQAVGFVIRNLDTFADTVEAEAKAMAERAKAVRSRANRVKEYLHKCMAMAGVNKLEHPEFTISMKKNPASVQIDGLDLIPEDYMREIPARFEPDKALIKKALQEGFEVPGASLTQSTRLEIK